MTMFEEVFKFAFWSFIFVIALVSVTYAAGAIDGYFHAKYCCQHSKQAKENFSVVGE
jgi:Skp family chaperone for outer membrane proteins